MPGRDFHSAARTAVFVAGGLGILLIALAAAWLVARDYRDTLNDAELTLDQFAIVLAEHTRIALRDADATVLQSITIPPAHQGGDGALAAETVDRFFADLFGQLDLAYQGRVFVFRDDGTLMALVPPAEGMVDRDFRDHPLFTKAFADVVAGGVQARGFVFPEDRLITWRRVWGYPLLVAFSTPLDEVLRPWWREAAIVGSGALLLASLFTAGTWLLARALRTTGRLAQDLTDREQRLQSIIGSAMDAIITIDERQEIVLFNVAAERTFGCKANEAIGSSIDRFIPERSRNAHREHVRRFGEAGVTMRRMGGDVVLSGLRSSGEEFPIDAAISHVAVEGRRFYTVILRDITQRQQAAAALARSRDELREMYDAMHEVRESERARIARELHDELAQWLTALKLDAAWIASRLGKEHAPLASKAEDMKAIVDNTVSAMRRIAADLRPVMLDDLGLVAAIDHLLHQLSERTGIRVDLRAAGHLAVGDPLATALYRMVQEALTNVARHAEASEVRVELAAAGERVRVSVRDNGRGLQIDPARKTFGLLGIRERARSLGGTARIYSANAGGTVVEIDVPSDTHAEGEGRRDTRRIG